MSVMPWDSLKDGIFDVIKDALQEMVPNNDDLELFKDLAGDLAKQKYLEAKADTEDERQRARDNIALLVNDIQARVTIKQLKLGKAGRDLAIKTVTAVVKTVAIPALIAL